MRFGTATIHLMQFGLLPGLRFKLGELGRQLVDPADRVARAAAALARLPLPVDLAVAASRSPDPLRRR